MLLYKEYESIQYQISVMDLKIMLVQALFILPYLLYLLHSKTKLI